MSDTGALSAGRRFQIPFSRLLTAAILLLGTYAAVLRFSSGLGAVTHLSDTSPWGIWIGFDVMCGVALASGGFTLTALVYLFGQKRFAPILRPTVLTAFLGYILVIFGLFFDLGKPQNMWHVLVMWNPHSVMFEVAWCVMLYSTVLLLEFSPIVLERIGQHRIAELIHKAIVPLVLAGVLLSTLHQSSLGTLFLVIPGKLYKLWYSPYLPVMFFFSAVTVGFAIIIFESYLSAYFFKKSLEKRLIVELSHFLLLALIFYITIKFQDLLARGMLPALIEPRVETYCFWLEILLLAVPAVFLTREKFRLNAHITFLCASSVILGLIINRLNVSMVGLYAYNNAVYLPSFFEVIISVALVTVGVLVFAFSVKHLNIFSADEHAIESTKQVNAQ